MNSKGKRNCLDRWEDAVEHYFKRPLLKGLIWTVRLAAFHPGKTVAVSIVISLACLAAGLATNFSLETDRDTLWTPTDSYSVKHREWIHSAASGFPAPDRHVQAIVHANGDNVLTLTAAHCLFDVLESIKNTTGYSEACAYSATGDCPVLAATSFFHHNRTEMKERLRDSDGSDWFGRIFSTLELRRIFSATKYPTGEPVFRDTIYGTPHPELPVNAWSSPTEENTTLTSAASYLLRVSEPQVDWEDVADFEINVVENVQHLNNVWKESGSPCAVSILTERSVDDENQRGIQADVPFMGLAFVIMGCACALYLSDYRNPVQSRSLLGVGAVATILLSISTGYGLLFLIGVPFTSVTQVFPYVMVGIGLDDTFILTGAYRRTNPNDSIVDCVTHVVQEVGISITASTMTTVAAFFLGCTSSIPGIRWFCLYAAPTVLIDFAYQITFFIAMLVYDDHRIKAHRYDCLVCVKANKTLASEDEEELPNNNNESAAVQDTEENKNKPTTFTAQLMASYARILLRPTSKIAVLVVFAVMLAFGALGASHQKQEFDFRKFVPSDSYVKTHFDNLDAYTVPETVAQYPVGIYFRHVNQSSEEIQRQMFNYVEDLVSLPYISNPPELFWLREFNEFRTEYAELLSLFNNTWEQQLDLFLKTEPAQTIFGPHVVRDEHGTVTASRTFVRFDQSSLFDVKNQIDSIHSAREITRAQPVNEGIDNWDFFVFGDLFMIWELYSVLIEEISLTVALGLLSVFVLSLLFIPHPIGPLLLTPVVAAIYIEVLAILYAADVFINGVSTIGLVMSVGLVVDYNMHVVLTYCEIKDVSTRNDRVFKCITTMGASILVGGFTTFLGVLPLLFTKSEVARTFFYVFLAVPLLGVAHGLILVPVILSLVGPLCRAENDPELSNDQQEG